MKIILYCLCFLLIVVSLIWGITQDGWFEPWTATLAAIIGLVSLFVSGNEGSQRQTNILSGSNSSKIKGNTRKARQTNFLGWGNTQEIDSSEEDKEAK